MALQDLIQQVNLFLKKEIEYIQKEASLRMKEVDGEFNKKIESLVEKKEKEIKEKEKTILQRKGKESEHGFEMMILKKKNEILKKAFSQIKKDFEGMDWNKKRLILKKELGKIKEFIDENTFFVVSKEEKEKILEILREEGIRELNVKEKNLLFKDGFLLENDRFVIEVFFEKIIEEELTQNKENFSKILFKD